MGVRATLLECYNPAMNVPGQTAAEGPLPIGQLPASASWIATATSITMGVTLPSWVVSGMNVYDVTNSQQIGTVTSGAGTTTLGVTSAGHASAGSTDVLQFGFSLPALNSGYTAGADIRAIMQTAQLRCSEAIALLNYLSTDVTLDATSAAIVSAQITALS